MAFRELTIAIPTYNRIEKLKKTLASVLPQLDHRCELLILDNCSSSPVEQALSELISSVREVSIRIVRNKVNIGADANIVRCFELCETKWLWTLSDDDDPQTNAIDIIFEDIRHHSNATVINYYSPNSIHPVRATTKIAVGRLEFIENIDFWGAAIFLSVNLYNCHKLKNHWLANHNTYSCSSQWLIAYHSLDANSITITSNKVICINPFSLGEEFYSPLNLSIAKGFATLLDIPMSKKEKLLFIEKLATATEKWITFDSIYKCLLVEYFNLKKDFDINFYLDRHYYSFFKYFGIKIFFKFIAFRSLTMISPNLAFNIARRLIMKRKGIDIINYLRDDL